MTPLQRLHEQYLFDLGARTSEVSRETYRQRTVRLWPFLGNKQPVDVSVGDINLFLLRISHRISGRQVATIRNHIMRFWRWLEDTEVIKVSPLIQRRTVRPVIIPPNRRPISADQYQAILKVAPTPWRELCIIGWHTGLRHSDVVGLRWDQVDLSGRVITVTPHKTRRFNKSVAIPMSGELHATLAEMRAHPEYPSLASSPLVFPDLCAYGKERLRIYFKLQKVFRKAGLPKGYSFHCFRHSFCTRLCNDGVSPLVISSMTGQTLQVLQGYVKVSMDAKRMALGIK